MDRLNPDARLGADGDAPSHGPDEFERLWRGFMTARVMLGVVLLALQTTFYVLGQARDDLLVLVCILYLVTTVWTRLFSTPRRLGRSFDLQALATVGVDIVVFAALQLVQGYGSVNYAPLLALPVLLSSVLGALPLAMGTAACVTLLLLGQALVTSYRLTLDPTPLYGQAALTGVGYFVIAFLATQLSARLAREEQRSQRSQLAVRVQRQVNALVIESMADGILVVDAQGTVWAANPAARGLLGLDPTPLPLLFDLGANPLWHDLQSLAQRSFATDAAQRGNAVFRPPQAGPQHVLVRTRMAATDDADVERLCVMVLQDQREMEARMRTEKLASMGRMSTAVAHEIRNPLAAIVQANALLDEDIADPRLKQLTRMVQQNAERLERIVDDVLNLSRLHSHGGATGGDTLALQEAVAYICAEWAQHGQSGRLLQASAAQALPDVVFNEGHLRRVLVNLLDNARRYASGVPGAIQVDCRMAGDGRVLLGVWSDGAPMEQSVQRHLFEPFFSSESRSTGLGLFLCRELCEGHGATIGFERTLRLRGGAQVEGNEFVVSFAVPPVDLFSAGPSDRIAATPWPPNRI